MKKESILLALGIATLVIYSSHWLFKYYGLPNAQLLKWAALAPFVLGALLMLLWRNDKKEDGD